MYKKITHLKKISLKLCNLFAIFFTRHNILFSDREKYELWSKILCFIRSFEQSDGQSHNANGELRNAGAEDAFVAVKGSYSWIGPDGVNYTVNYIADENGYQPTIEQGPGGAVPSAVVASLLG